MTLYQWDAVPVENLSPLFARQVIHSQRMTIARLIIRKGMIVPTHSHENEQVSMVASGSLRFVLDGVEQMVRAGETLVIPPNVPHSAEAVEDTDVMDVFSGPREDWIRGDDAYLRAK